ncbi:tRNA (N6-threonylcarbamoyladenosine(37)-N6)-methyltransferase TrmO [Bacteroidota bacterium]
MILYDAIGIIHTPYKELAPFRAEENAKGDFYIKIEPRFMDALYLLEKFNYVHVLFHIDRAKHYKLKVHPPNANGNEVGLFASRSPNRPNPIGLSIVRIKKIEKNIIYTTGLDVLDHTPLLDIKPYIPAVDIKPDSNSGWIEE